MALLVAQRFSIEPEAGLQQATLRSVRIVGMRLERRVEPEMIGRRDRADRGASVSAKNDAAKIVAINPLGNGAPELLRGEPGLLVCRNGRGSDLIEPYLLRIK